MQLLLASVEAGQKDGDGRPRRVRGPAQIAHHGRALERDGDTLDRRIGTARSNCGAGLGEHVYAVPLPPAGAHQAMPAPPLPPLPPVPPVMTDQAPGAPVVVQNDRFCPAAAFKLSITCYCVTTIDVGVLGTL